MVNRIRGWLCRVSRGDDRHDGGQVIMAEMIIVTNRTGHSTVYEAVTRRYLGSFDTRAEAEAFVGWYQR